MPFTFTGKKLQQMNTTAKKTTRSELIASERDAQLFLMQLFALKNHQKH
jgi:hypothetical protein